MPEIILAAAVFLDILFGEPSSSLHPTVFMGKYIGWFWSRCPSRRKAVEFVWGLILIILGLLLFAGPVFLLTRLLSGQKIIYLIMAVPLLKVSFSVRYLLKSGMDIKKELENGNLAMARELTSYHLVSRNTDSLTDEEICSCVIESLSENITDSFSSPVFFYFILGLPGAWAYRLINTSDAMIAYRNEKYEWGGKFTAWCDTLLNWIPARLTAFTILLASLAIPGASFRKALASLVGEHRNTASPNAGWTMSAMAGALNVTLVKKGEYILSGGEDRLEPSKIDMCIKITVLSLLLVMILMTGLYRGGLWLLSTAV